MHCKFYLYIMVTFMLLNSTANAQIYPIFSSDHNQTEPHIAVNPANPNNLIGTCITIESVGLVEIKYISVFNSFDGGQTWSGYSDISGEGGADPVIAFDPDGIAYLLYQKRAISGLYLKISEDGGINWSQENEIVNYNPEYKMVDRPWMAISPLREGGHFKIYISFTVTSGTFGQNNVIEIYNSEDGGQTFDQFRSAFGKTLSHYPHGSSVAVSRN